MDEHKRIKEREEGDKARQILENPVFVDTWAKMDANLLSRMTDPGADDEVVLEAKRGLVILRRVKSEIERTMQTGQMAVMELNG